jgi:hypothetical protein
MIIHPTVKESWSPEKSLEIVEGQIWNPQSQKAAALQEDQVSIDRSSGVGHPQSWIPRPCCQISNLVQTMFLGNALACSVRIHWRNACLLLPSTPLWTFVALQIHSYSLDKLKTQQQFSVFHTFPTFNLTIKHARNLHKITLKESLISLLIPAKTLNYASHDY